jgi:16S rRNA (cytidine1402-2'-O)-methyltransferase
MEPPIFPSAARSRKRGGVLYVVATPLGNLEDITLRALRVLKEVDLIAAEDTRHSRKLLQHYGISTRLTSYHDHSERDKAPKLVHDLQHGMSIALISDAGTPAISDPGFHLVRAAIAADIPVVPIPGASAVSAALSASGLPPDRFIFEGFVPAKASQRRKFFSALSNEERTIVVYESARRLLDSLRDLREVLGDRDVVIARELTKIFEEFRRGPVSSLITELEQTATQGEVTLLIAGGKLDIPALPPEDIAAAIARLRGDGLSLKDVARTLARERGLSRREIYKLGIAAEEK